MLIAMMLAGTIAFWGCTGAIDPNNTPAAITGEIATLTDTANTYFATHDLVNTNPVDLAKQSQTYSNQYGDLLKRATDLQNKIKDPSWTNILGLAQEGMSTLNMLTAALGMNPAQDVTGYAALQKAMEGWAQYNNKVDTALAAKIAEGEAAKSGSTVKPLPDLPGKGKHYGWWKNPAWANDPASRGMYPPMPGPDPKEQEKDKQKEQDKDKNKDKNKDKDNRDRGNLGLRVY
jgi:hypothetical protein